jgi:hypothetical protein
VEGKFISQYLLTHLLQCPLIIQGIFVLLKFAFETHHTAPPVNSYLDPARILSLSKSNTTSFIKYQNPTLPLTSYQTIF